MCGLPARDPGYLIAVVEHGGNLPSTSRVRGKHEIINIESWLVLNEQQESET
jgi:hypothetical protein